MKWNKVEVMIYSKTTPFTNPGFKINYPGITLEKAEVLENPKYASLALLVGQDAKPGMVTLEWTQGKKTQRVNWELKARREGKGTTFAQGISSEDLVYLLMPDRFSNGNPSNDRIAGMRDQTLNRDSIYHRHGGDLQGVINHLDYLQNLGVTALWMTPVIENDMPDRTEHGYAFTNHYKIEPRFGEAEVYKRLSDELHKRGMKLVQDAVYNHVGLYHVMVQDKPVKDWLHEWPTYTNTNYKDATVFDPYGSEKEKKIMTNGWFTPMMPDMNHENPRVANFLIQHALWSVEEFGVDAWRIDTYMYNGLEFMNRCNQALLDEYPKLFMFGETWVHGTVNQAYFTENNLNVPFKSNLPGVTDFQALNYGIIPALEKPSEGLNKMYLMYSNDVLYKDPLKLVTFLDNHDLNRFFTQVGEDVSKHKMAMGWLLTSRGIPQLYYGSEVIMKGATYPKDGWVRLDFPGGWPGDKKNAFTQEGLSSDEKSVQDFVKAIANFRKNSSAIKTGSTRQYIPKNDCYVYFRYDAKQTVMVVLNIKDKPQQIRLSDYEENTKGFASARDVVTGANYSEVFSVEGKTIAVMVLEK
jgi:neopullulanase